MLPSTIDEDGRASQRQHLMSMVIDDRISIDAGCLAFSCSDLQREQVRDIILTHTHLDHIAGLPMFVDDLFASLERPICVHGTREMIDILERHVFNWEIYPKFSDLTNDFGTVLEYREFQPGEELSIEGLAVRSIPVHHDVNACGYIISDGKATIAVTGDTAETNAFWDECNALKHLSAMFVECAFPDELDDLAQVSCHLTPSKLATEIAKFSHPECPVYIINLKPMYRDKIISELAAKLPSVKILDVGRVYDL